jgi:hypothetical protein
MLVAIENGQGGFAARTLRRLRRVGWDYRQVSYFDRKAVDEVAGLLPIVETHTHAMPPIWLIVAQRPVGDDAQR